MVVIRKSHRIFTIQTSSNALRLQVNVVRIGRPVDRANCNKRCQFERCRFERCRFKRCLRKLGIDGDCVTDRPIKREDACKGIFCLVIVTGMYHFHCIFTVCGWSFLVARTLWRLRRDASEVQKLWGAMKAEDRERGRGRKIEEKIAVDS